MSEITKVQTLALETEQLFDTVVNHSYLAELSYSNVIPYVAVSHPDVTWFKISKVVHENGVFFADRLSMLYAALHGKAQVVALVLHKRKISEPVELLIGTRDHTGNVSGRILEAGLKGILPGVRYETFEKETLDLFDADTIQAVDPNRYGVAAVSGVASLHEDDKKDKFTQGIERLINSTSDIPQFTALFLAESLSEVEVNTIQSNLEELYSAISPLSETQLTYSCADATTITDSISHGINKSVSESVNRTITHGTGSNEQKSTQESRGSNKGGGLAFLVSANYSRSTNKSWTESVTSTINDSVAKSVGETISNSTTDTTSLSLATQMTSTLGNQISIHNRHVKSCMDIIDKQIERLMQSRPYGLWGMATYFIAKSQTRAQQLANIYRGTIVGDQSGLEALCINRWEVGNENVKPIIEYLRHLEHPRFNIHDKLYNIKPTAIVNSKELAIHMSLPQSSVPGILVRDEEVFGRNVITSTALDETNSIPLGCISHLGEEYHNESVRLGIDGLSKHVFVTGTTGSGKSNVLYLLLDELSQRGHTFLVIEPAKGEYKNIFGQRKDVIVLGNNPKMSPLLRINPFRFPDGIHVYEHIDQLLEIFNACWPMYAAMPQVLKHAIEQAYRDCGWDLIRSDNRLGLYPTVRDVLNALKIYINESDYSSNTKGDYKGSLETRLQSLCDGISGQIFGGESISDDALFNHNVIVDLSRVKSSETKSLIMGLLVMKLSEYRISENKGMNLPLRHVTVLEEAHNLLKATSTNQSSEGSNIMGMAVEKITNCIAEMRTYGEGFIIADQSPTMLDAAVLRNTNTKIIMNLPERNDRESSGLSVGLTDKQVDELSRLKTGEAIVYQNGWEEAVKCKVNRFNGVEDLWVEWADKSMFKPDDKEPLLASALYHGYATGTKAPSLAQRIMMETLIRASSMPSSNKAAALKILQKHETMSSDIYALLMAAMVGKDVFATLSNTTKDITQLNNALAYMLGKLPWVNAHYINTYINMYVKGCALTNSHNFYNQWLIATHKNK